MEYSSEVHYHVLCMMQQYSITAVDHHSKLLLICITLHEGEGSRSSFISRHRGRGCRRVDTKKHHTVRFQTSPLRHRHFLLWSNRIELSESLEGAPSYFADILRFTASTPVVCVRVNARLSHSGRHRCHPDLSCPPFKGRLSTFYPILLIL